MKIVLCGGIVFSHEMKRIADELEQHGHAAEIPLTSHRILSGELTLEDFKKEEASGAASHRKISDDVIRKYYHLIKAADAILIVNMDRNNVPNYIGGNTFLEMGFAHVLNKKIFVYNDIPQMHYTDEIAAMQPTVLKGSLSLLHKKDDQTTV